MVGISKQAGFGGAPMRLSWIVVRMTSWCELEALLSSLQQMISRSCSDTGDELPLEDDLEERATSMLESELPLPTK